VTDDDDDCSERVAELRQIARETKAVLDRLERRLETWPIECRSWRRSSRRYFIALLVTYIVGWSACILAAAHGFGWI
jgi:hypothetical protein